MLRVMDHVVGDVSGKKGFELVTLKQHKCQPGSGTKLKILSKLPIIRQKRNKTSF
jgi:hypothetical protein